MKSNMATLPTEPFLARLIPRGDGTYAITPLLSCSQETTLNGEVWLTAEKAAQLLRPCSRASVYRFADDGLIEDHYPSPGRRLFGLNSIMKLRAKREADREFWIRPQGR